MTFLKVCLEGFDRIDEISSNAHNRLLGSAVLVST
jgi:hypothetical protein